MLVSAAETGMPQSSKRLQFSQIDLNGDNLISKLEITVYAKTQFERADSNRDGSLSLSELIARRLANTSVRLQKMIDKADTNSDGLVDFNELEASRNKRRGVNIFDKFDADNDGQLTAEEFSMIKKPIGSGKKRKKYYGVVQGGANN